MGEKKIYGFVARNKNGELKLFRTYPLRQPDIYEAYDNYGDGCLDYVYHENTHWDAGCGDHGMTLPIDMFPDITWESDPLEVYFILDVAKDNDYSYLATKSKKV